MNLWMLVPGDTTGKKLYNLFVAVALVGMLTWMVFGNLISKYWKFQAHRQETRAERAEQNAATATANANSANAGAANAALTHAAIAGGVIEIRLKTDQAAARVETHETPVDDSGALPADLVRELDAARGSAGAAANRLRGTRAR